MWAPSAGPSTSRGGLPAVVGAALVLFGTGVLGAVAAPSLADGLPHTGVPQTWHVAGAANCSGILSPTLIEGSVGTSYATEVGVMFNTVCASAEFQALVASWGAMNVSLETYSNAQGLRFANFTVTWVNWSGVTYYANEAYWAGNISTGQVSGPFVSSFPGVACYGPAAECAGLHSGPPPAVTYLLVLVVGVAAVLLAAAVVGGYLAWTRHRRGPGENPP